MHDGFGQVREGEEEEVPGLAELVWVVQSLRELPRVGRVEDGQPVHDLGWIIAVAQAAVPPQSWPTRNADWAPRRG